LLLLLWGCFVLWLSLTGQLAAFLHPSLQPFTLVAGIVLLLLSAFGLRSLFLRPQTSETHHDCCQGGHDHGDNGHTHCHSGVEDAETKHDHSTHGIGTSGVLVLTCKTILLLLPLTIILSGRTTGFSMTTVQNRGVVDNIDNLPSAKSTAASSTPLNSSSAVSSGAPMPLQVIDMLYGIQMPSYRSEFEGKEVELIGQFVPLTTGNPKGDRFQAIRMFITCCAADAKPVGVTVRYPKPLTLSEMSWVRITGKPVFPMEGGRRTALLEATKVEECPAPNEPFVY